MRETMKWAALGTGAALVTVLGCYDFGEAYESCVTDERCPLPPIPCVAGSEDVAGDFQDADCDGIDGTASLGFFVDINAGTNTSASGGLDQPFKTLDYALTRLTPDTRFLFIAQGTYDGTGLVLDKPITLLGGYSGKAGNWQRARSYTTEIIASGIGLTMSGTDGGTSPALQWLNVTSTKNADAGGASVALRVLNADGVLLQHVVLSAAVGTDGTAGQNGTPGPGGADGGTGGSNTDASTQDAGAGGDPGLSNCGPSGNSGGMGGKSADLPPVGTAFDPTGKSGQPGRPSNPGGAGGLGCDEGTRASCAGPGSKNCTCTALPGEPGASGDAGTPGPAGDAGSNTGTLSDNTWVAVFGVSGRPSTSGTAGGGGGAGGSADLWRRTRAMGGGGGGGGAAGCGGQPGTGGQGGGASIALLLVNSRVELDTCRLLTEKGGAGGAGGTGGQGGPGGAGGAGGLSFTNVNAGEPLDVDTANGGRGGNGGHGGPGGSGGHGGNGAGGPSVGIWCQGSTVTETGTTWRLGSPGAPGSGPAPAPAAGIGGNTYGCNAPATP